MNIFSVPVVFPKYLMKELYRTPDDPKKIEADILQMTHVQVMKCLLYGQEKSVRKALDYGLLDPRLGATKRDDACVTCGLDYSTCIGHWGYIELPFPVFHTCSRVLIPVELRGRLMKICSNPNMDYVQKKSIRKAIHLVASKNHICSFCGATNGMVKKSLSYLTHEPYRTSIKKMNDYVNKLKKNNLKPEYLPMAEKGIVSQSSNFFQQVIRAHEVLDLFSRIPSEDKVLLLMPDNQKWGSDPTSLILNKIPVPPNAIRPSVISEGRMGTNEDDLTQMYQWILAQAATMEGEISEVDHIACTDNLHAEIARLLNSQQSGLPPTSDFKFMRGILQRLSGKMGRFRGNLLGKRTNYTARTVISPDPNMRIDQVTIPEHCARLLTYPERVTDHNIEFLKKLIMNGPHKHPGALFVIYRSNDDPSMTSIKGTTLLPGQPLPINMNTSINTQVVKRFLASPIIRENVAKNLKPGDIVERHLIDGDIVLFNRQPSLHRVSIMAFNAVVKPFRTLRFNPSCCGPFNADFDGDEMNIHLTQNEEARAEARHLMSSLNNICSPKNGEPLISPLQDMLTAAHLITHKDTFFSKQEAYQIISQILCNDQHYKKRIRLVSYIIQPTKDVKIAINLRCSTKSFYCGSKEELCHNDGYVVIHNGSHLAGCMDKKLLGSGSKSSIFYRIIKDYGGEACSDSIWRLSRICLYFLAHRGISIGIGDVTPSFSLIEAKKSIIKKGFEICDDYISQYEKNTLKCTPGCSMEVTLESLLSQELSKIRDQAGSACKATLDNFNSPLIMAQCGSKGSFLNISQMISCVGQQIIGGKRIPSILDGRSLVHFYKGAMTPEAKGFVENSFYSGLTPPEFFFHAMSGREGLTDTAVKTADTGYMQRRLVKFLEDLSVNYDDTVRDSKSDIIQFKYGADSLDPFEMENNDFPINLDDLLLNIKCRYPYTSNKWNPPEEIIKQINCIFKSDHYKKYRNFVQETIIEFVKSKICTPLETILSKVKDAKKLNVIIPKCNLGLSEIQLNEFIQTCCRKFELAKIQPGTAVGAITGQSVGEPATQMTLKTFHFAGVASMSITQGVPRMREIVNAVQNIKTPLITVHLTNPKDIEFARNVKLLIEPTRLGDISVCIRQCIVPDNVFIAIHLNSKRMKRRNITVTDVVYALNESQKSRVKKHKISKILSGEETIQIFVKEENQLEQAIKYLEMVVVKGIPGVKRVVIQSENDGSHKMFVEGPRLKEVMGIPGVVPETCTSNNIIEVEQVLGVEAARIVAMKELESVMAGHGVDLNIRHLMLLADLMTNKGRVYGYQRDGMAKAKNSVLCLASFERTGDHLYEAAYHSQEDHLVGVTENIIIGNVIKLGTGSIDVLYNYQNNYQRIKKNVLIN